MQLMNVKEWSQLDVTGKKHWLSTQTPTNLEYILVIVAEMLANVNDLDAEIAMLPQNDDLDAARISTTDVLRDMERCIVGTLITLKEKTM